MSARGCALHGSGEREFEFADAFGVDGELRAADAAGVDGDGSCWAVSSTSENQSSGLKFEGDVAACAGVVVDANRNGDAIALGEGDGQVEVDEEVLEDFEAGGAAAECAVLGGGEHGHAPGGDGVGDGDGDAGVAVGVGDDFGIDVEGFGEVGADVRSRAVRPLRSCVVNDHTGSWHGRSVRRALASISTSCCGHCYGPPMAPSTDSAARCRPWLRAGAAIGTAMHCVPATTLTVSVYGTNVQSDGRGRRDRGAEG